MGRFFCRSAKHGDLQDGSFKARCQRGDPRHLLSTWPRGRAMTRGRKTAGSRRAAPSSSRPQASVMMDHRDPTTPAPFSFSSATPLILGSLPGSHCHCDPSPSSILLQFTPLLVILLLSYSTPLQEPPSRWVWFLHPPHTYSSRRPLTPIDRLVDSWQMGLFLSLWFSWLRFGRAGGGWEGSWRGRQCENERRRRAWGDEEPFKEGVIGLVDSLFFTSVLSL